MANETLRAAAATLLTLLTACGTRADQAPPVAETGTPAVGPASGHLFVWAGDADRRHTDFLAVVDVDPNSVSYGEIAATVGVADKGTYPHHTEHEMPADGVLFANGFGANRTYRFDLTNPLEPKLLGSFVAGEPYTHPHSYARLPNGNVLATFQMKGHDNGEPGALVELNPEGGVARLAGAAAPDIDKFVRPYSLVVVPSLDRVVTSSADIHAKEISQVVQVWRLSSLELLKTVVLPPPPRGDEGFDSAEPRLLADGRTVLVVTFSCGLYRMVGLETTDPAAVLVHTFDSKECALPVVAGRFWVQALSEAGALVSLDVSDPATPVEVSRLGLHADEPPHWIALEPGGERIVISGGSGALESRLLTARIDPRSGALALDETFREEGAERPGISLDRETWPHGAAGRAIPHGAVFSRR